MCIFNLINYIIYHSNTSDKYKAYANNVFLILDLPWFQDKVLRNKDSLELTWLILLISSKVKSVFNIILPRLILWMRRAPTPAASPQFLCRHYGPIWAYLIYRVLSRAILWSLSLCRYMLLSRGLSWSILQKPRFDLL